MDVVLKAWSSINENADTVPVIHGGDYNSASHLDDGIGKSGHSKLMADAGFVDSFRQLHPDVEKYPGSSIGSSGKDRIDYIYYKGTKLNAIKTDPIVREFKGSGQRTPGYPSDHLGVVTRFKFESDTPAKLPIVGFKFDGDVSSSTASIKADVRRPSSFIDGVSGKALDLTRRVRHRYGLDLGRSEKLDFGAEKDFSVLVWVKTLPGAELGNAIVTNLDWAKARNEDKELRGSKEVTGPGWGIASQPSGSWSWIMSDGDKYRFDYEPTAQRQPINDGKWHQLAFTVKRKTKEVCLYYDCRKVATYFIWNLKSVTSALNTMIGTCNLGSYNGEGFTASMA